MEKNKLKFIVLISDLSVYAGYPKDYIKNEQWKPKPKIKDKSFLYFMIEMIFKEYCYENKIPVFCLRYCPNEIKSNFTLFLTSINKFININPKYNFNIFNISNSSEYTIYDYTNY